MFETFKKIEVSDDVTREALNNLTSKQGDLLLFAIETKSEQKVLKRANHNSDIPLVKSHKLNPRLMKLPVYYTIKRGNGIGIYKDHKEFIKAIKGINNPLYYVFTDLNSATYWLNESPVYPDYDSGQEMTPKERKRILHTAESRENYMPHMNITHTIYYFFLILIQIKDKNNENIKNATDSKSVA